MCLSFSLFTLTAAPICNTRLFTFSGRMQTLVLPAVVVGPFPPASLCGEEAAVTDVW